jgi:chloramphenicol 3-O-phosphotransferase
MENAVSPTGPRPGTILIVTGTTGSGKTTTCKQFVAQAEALWLHFGIDLFLGTIVPRKFVDGGPRDHEGVHMAAVDVADPDGARHLVLGELGWGMIAAFHRMVAAAARAGQNVALDHITSLDPAILQDCLRTLHGLPVFFVALRPPAEILPLRIDSRLEAVAEILGREHAQRNNANTKLASEYIGREIFSHDIFDLVVDTHAHRPEEVAGIIARALTQHHGTAFAQLAERLDAGLAPFNRAACLYSA